MNHRAFKNNKWNCVQRNRHHKQWCVMFLPPLESLRRRLCACTCCGPCCLLSPKTQQPLRNKCGGGKATSIQSWNAAQEDRSMPTRARQSVTHPKPSARFECPREVKTYKMCRAKWNKSLINPERLPTVPLNARWGLLIGWGSLLLQPPHPTLTPPVSLTRTKRSTRVYYRFTAVRRVTPSSLCLCLHPANRLKLYLRGARHGGGWEERATGPACSARVYLRLICSCLQCVSLSVNVEHLELKRPLCHTHCVPVFVFACIIFTLKMQKGWKGFYWNTFPPQSENKAVSKYWQSISKFWVRKITRNFPEVKTYLYLKILPSQNNEELIN